jgi:alkylhydroperoxidase family enzyme
MDREPTYGATFVRHLAKLGRQTPYRYEDLQLVKAMSQAELADWIKTECPEFSQVVRDNPADVAAAIVHKRRAEMTERSVAVAECTVTFLERMAYLFSAVR